MLDRASCVVCLITDRRRFGGDDRTAVGALVALVGEAADGAVDLVQIRERDLEANRLLDLAERCVDAVRGSQTRILVNDRLDVATASGAAGTHLRGDSFGAADARRVAPAGHLIGRSVHDTEEAVDVERAGGLDYLLFGSVLPTESKPHGHVPAGWTALAAVSASVSLPVLAVGGMSLDVLPDVARAGAAGFAAIGFFVQDGRMRGGGSPIASRVRLARAAFDRSRPHP